MALAALSLYRRALAEGSKEVDPDSFTDWGADPVAFAGYQFLRYRITFDIAADGSDLEPDSRRPVVNSIRILSEF